MPVFPWLAPLSMGHNMSGPHRAYGDFAARVPQQDYPPGSGKGGQKALVAARKTAIRGRTAGAGPYGIGGVAMKVRPGFSMVGILIAACVLFLLCGSGENREPKLISDR